MGECLPTHPNTDGVVIDYEVFGRVGSLSPNFDKGRTGTHEVGHWLNLRHIWGDTLNCSASDFVDDTPNQYKNSEGCPSFPQTDACTTTYPGIMFMNFMDYTDDACMNMFTAGQVERMRAVFDSQIGQRKGMLACANFLTNTPIPSEIEYYNNGNRTHPAGVQIGLRTRSS